MSTKLKGDSAEIWVRWHGTHRRTTVTARQAEFPAASYARTVTTFVPTSSGTIADQDVVPIAAPEPPVDVVHLTAVIPTLSLATPLKAMDAAPVEAIEEPGVLICSDGAEVSTGVGLGAVG